MKYWKKIKLKNLDVIQKKAEEFLDKEKEKFLTNPQDLRNIVPVFLFDHKEHTFLQRIHK